MTDFALEVARTLSQAKSSRPERCGTLVRLVGLRMEARGIMAPIGANCEVIGQDGQIIEAEVVGHDDQFNLMYLSFSGGQFTVTDSELPLETKVRLRISARDVSLTQEQQTDTSILNIFSAIVDEIVPEGQSQVMVRLKIKDVTMLSCITRKSAELLELNPGKKVYAQIKSVALLS